MSNNNRSSPKSAPIFDYGYVIVIASFLIIMANVGMFLTIGVFFKPIMNDFGWSRAIISAPLALSSIVSGLSSVLAGRLADKFGPRIVVSVFATITGLGYILMSRLSNIWELYLYLGVFLGTGAAGTLALMSTVPRWFVKRRTAMSGIISAGGGVGGLIMPLLANWLISRYSWQQAYFFIGIAYLVIILTAAQLLKKSPDRLEPPPEILVSPSIKSDLHLQRHSESALFKLRQFWLMVVLFFAFGFCIMTINFHIVNHATDLNISPIAAAGILSIYNGLSIVGSILFGVIGDRFGNQRLLIYTFAVLAASLFSLLFLKHLWMLDIFAVVFGLAFGSGLAQTPAIVARFFGTAALGLVLGFVNFSQTLGGSLGSYFAGFVYDVSGNSQLIFIACTIFSLIGVAVTTRLKPFAPEQSQPAAYPPPR